MILDIYKDSFEYSAQDGISLLKLGIINILNFLIIPIFLQMGYSYRINKIAVNGMINGNDQLADYSDLVSMFVDGLKVCGVYIVYLIIPFLIGLLAILTGNITISIIGIIIAFILGIITYLMAVIAIPHMAASDDNFKAALDYKEIIEIIKSISVLRFIAFYLGLIIIVVCITSIVYMIIGFLLSVLGLGLTLANPIIGLGFFDVGLILSGLFLSLLVTPYLTIFQSRAIGLIYNLR